MSVSKDEFEPKLIGFTATGAEVDRRPASNGRRGRSSRPWKMKCGVGKYGRCNIGSKFVCLDGPLFTLTQLKELPREF